MNRRSGILLLAVAALTLSWARAAGAQARPSGELVWALHVSISPSWFDPGEHGGLITPFVVQKARQLLAEAGYPSGCDAGELGPIPPFFEVGEAVMNDLNAIGMRVKMRAMERSAFDTAWREKKLRGIFVTADGSSGNAATRVESFMYSKGTYAYGGYPDIDALFQQQRQERDRAKREALLHHIQQLTVERVMFAPIMDLRGLIGVGPRVAEHTIHSIPLHPGPAFQNIRLKGP
jgi:peptide/nickel transport system substrate-binding protein